MPEPIIAFPLTYRNLIYMTAIVNCSDVQGCSWDLPEGQKLNGSRAPRGPLRGNPKNRRFGFCRDRDRRIEHLDRKSTRLNSSHGYISYAVFCLKKKKIRNVLTRTDPTQNTSSM